MDDALRERVRRRAGSRCEYCRGRQEDYPVFRFHVEHVIAEKHGGTDDEENLALACQQCNLHKGSNLSGIDPDTNTVVLLFHPRKNDWNEHFSAHGSRIVGLTPTGRATVRVLNINDDDRVRLRAELGYPGTPQAE